jgi:hypothetical protein
MIWRLRLVWTGIGHYPTREISILPPKDRRKPDFGKAQSAEQVRRQDGSGRREFAENGFVKVAILSGIYPTRNPSILPTKERIKHEILLATPQYFAREALGKDIGRKSPLREKRGQERNAAYLAWIGNRRSTAETLGGQMDHSTEGWTSRRQEDR